MIGLWHVSHYTKGFFVVKVVVPKETATHENRVAITPEIAKKLIESGLTVTVEKGAGLNAGILDEAYELAGATLTKDKGKLYKEGGLVIRVQPPSEDELDLLPSGSVLIGMLKPHASKDQLKAYASKKIVAVALELLPRISRAQSMDVLSSQSNLVGYKAVVDAASEFGRAFPMMMTAAGTVAPARVLIIGAGVAGLQAIATARRLGAIVSAFDVRKVVKEQVESLGATFVEVDSSEEGEGTGGYAKEMSAEYKKRQAEKLAETLKNNDVVITTAQIPGKPAPELITEAMVKEMKPGSLIVDLAIESGGNCPSLAKINEIVTTKQGVKIMAYANVASRIASDASHVYARNVFQLIKTMLDPETGIFFLNWEDEIIKATVLTRDGAIVHPSFATKK